MQDEELMDSLAQLAVALDDFDDCLAQHDACDGVALHVPAETRGLVTALTDQAERIGIAWEEDLADLNDLVEGGSRAS